MTTYPASIDNNSSLPAAALNTGLKPQLFNDLRSAILAVESELGTNISSTYGNLKGRLAYIDSYLQSVTDQLVLIVSGDLGGDPGDIKVTGLYGKPVSSNIPAENNSLVWNGTNWAPSPAYINLDYTAIVSTNGNDATGTLNSVTKPFKTLKKAVQSITEDGYTILMMGGTYNESPSVSIANSIVIKSIGKVTLPSVTISLGSTGTLITYDIQINEIQGSGTLVMNNTEVNTILLTDSNVNMYGACIISSLDITLSDGYAVNIYEGSRIADALITCEYATVTTSSVFTSAAYYNNLELRLDNCAANICGCTVGRLILTDSAASATILTYPTIYAEGLILDNQLDGYIHVNNGAILSTGTTVDFDSITVTAPSTWLRKSANSITYSSGNTPIPVNGTVTLTPVTGSGDAFLINEGEVYSIIIECVMYNDSGTPANFTQTIVCSVAKKFTTVEITTKELIMNSSGLSFTVDIPVSTNPIEIHIHNVSSTQTAKATAKLTWTKLV